MPGLADAAVAVQGSLQPSGNRVDKGVMRSDEQKWDLIAQTYHRRREELLATASGMYVAAFAGKLLGPFDTVYDALCAGRSLARQNSEAFRCIEIGREDPLADDMD